MKLPFWNSRGFEIVRIFGIPKIRVKIWMKLPLSPWNFGIPKLGVSFFWKLVKLPPFSNSRGSEILQISGILITAGIFESGYSPPKWLSFESTDSFTERFETPFAWNSRGSRIVHNLGIPKIGNVCGGGVDETPSNWLSELRSGSFTEKNETPCVWHPRGSGIEKIGVVFGKEWNSLCLKLPRF